MWHEEGSAEDRELQQLFDQPVEVPPDLSQKVLHYCHTKRVAQWRLRLAVAMGLWCLASTLLLWRQALEMARELALWFQQICWNLDLSPKEQGGGELLWMGAAGICAVLALGLLRKWARDSVWEGE